MWIPLNIGMLWSTEWKSQRLIHMLDKHYCSNCFIVLSVMLLLAVVISLYQLWDYNTPRVLQEYCGSWESRFVKKPLKGCAASFTLSQRKTWLTMKSDSRLERKAVPRLQTSYTAHRRMLRATRTEGRNAPAILQYVGQAGRDNQM